MKEFNTGYRYSLNQAKTFKIKNILQKNMYIWSPWSYSLQLWKNAIVMKIYNLLSTHGQTNYSANFIVIG